MSRIGIRLKKVAIFIHGWMGVAFCLIFLLWFTSGIVLIYCDYPRVSEADRLAHSPPLDVSHIQLSPARALARLQSSNVPTEVRLISFDGRPAYRFHFGRGEAMVYADNGEIQSAFSPEITLRIASAWTRQPAENARVEVITQEDQWTVSGEFRALRPIRKYSWPDGEDIYVSIVTGDVVQYTTRASRIGAYFGAIPHWLYFTPLRKHGNVWSRVVIWVSGLGTIATVLGLVIGVWTYSSPNPFRYAGKPSRIPYAGPKRWHMILGLVFGPLACTWVFSGMLSMDPFPQLQSGSSSVTGVRLGQALRGLSLSMEAFSAKLPQEALAEIGSDFHPEELELSSFLGEPIYLATTASNQTRIVPVRSRPTDEFDRESIVAGLRQAAKPFELEQVRLVTQYEAYYLDRHKLLPLPVIFVQLNDKERSMYYVDPKTARIVQAYDSHARWNRWLYHGLHSLDLPWLYRYRPVWDIVVLILLAGGITLCITSLLLAWRVVWRTLGPRDSAHSS
jgi:hypothetical protein